MQINERSRRLLKRSIICVGISWILILGMVPLLMSMATEKVIIEISNEYMSEINKQIKQKFSSIISLRVVQLDGIYKRTPPDAAGSREDKLDQLRISAEIREMSSLCFLSADGQVETVYGDDIVLVDRESCLTYLKNKEKIVSRGYNQRGEQVLVLGTEAAYEMNNGQKSAALLAAIPMDYLEEVLFVQEEKAHMHFHIIDEDGDFVVKGLDIPQNNYFECLLTGAETNDGRSPESLVRELNSKIDAHEDYAAFFHYMGEDRHIYCSAIYPNFNWHIVIVMPKGVVTESISMLDETWLFILLGSIVIIATGVFIVFMMYFRLKEREMKELDESRKEAIQANRAKSEFLSSMSHDIRTPMNAIMGMTELALRAGSDTERTQEYLKKISASSKQLLALLNDILDMSKIESGKMKLKENIISLRDIINDNVMIIRPLAKEKEQQFDVYVQDLVTEEIKGDSIRLNQMITNLLSNAVKFTPPGGRIHLYLYQEESPKGDSYVRTHLYVSDTGIGMSKEFQEKIYETFTREENEYVQQITGTGLGMSIIKSIVEVMEGSIELESEVGKGTEFHVTLDLKRAKAREDNTRLPEWNILVMEKQVQLVSGAVEGLNQLGILAEGTEDIRQGIRMLEEHEKEQKPYDFILLDYNLLKQDAIREFYQVLENKGDSRPVVLLSVYDTGEVGEEEQTDLPYFDGLVQKPLFKSTLSECLSQYVETMQETSAKRKNQQIDFTDKRVLVAEDIDINWEIVYELLSSMGLELERAVNGKECVDKIQDSQTGYYDAVLMDIRMPVMNGYDATKAIRKLERADKDLPIIAMTADAFLDDVQYCLNCGMNGHLAKPLDIKECIRLLQQFLK